MAWRIVKQPNGLYGRFSDIVDNFTSMNMTEAEALAECQHYLGVVEAAQKVAAGVRDLKPWTTEPGSGTDRWDDSIRTIRAMHGDETVAEIVALGSKNETNT